MDRALAARGHSRAIGTAVAEASTYLGLAGIEKLYAGGTAPAVAAIDLTIRQGEFLTLLGPSGCGKTTILRMIAGLVPPSAGRIRLAGSDITRQPVHRRNMGLVFQSYALFPHLSVARNVAFGLEMRGVKTEAAQKRVADALALVRLEGLAERRPASLSGGQQQRVALARALVIEPAVLLLDEPLSNLDAKLREELREEIRDIQRRLGITTVFVTHDQEEALTMSDRIVVMNAGRIEQVGSPTEIYEKPKTPFVAGFIGRMNRIEAKVTASKGGYSILEAAGMRLAAPLTLPQGASATVMVRPHRIHLARTGSDAAARQNSVRAKISKVTFAGETVQYEISAGGNTLRVESQTSSA
ncbi:MAG: ABC transporter ATP-binding protein, partial [Alphaproteobacteria bacterium]|nr:ABC transporter ATP-binding protein [Alphaproteobacteria bacterium]